MTNGQPGTTDHDLIVLADSITALEPTVAGRVAVCGSHTGDVVGRMALSLAVSGLVGNDAGAGKEDAGTAGLLLLERAGTPGVAVDFRTARIGDGVDTYESGVVSSMNGPASDLGITVGSSAHDAAIAMARQRSDLPPPELEFRDTKTIVVVADGPPPIVLMDSAGWITDEHSDAIVVTGSHGGEVSGRAVKSAVAVAVFNDAGVGKDRSGIGRLTILEADGIPGMTVAHTSARIGDGLDTYESGVISYVNQQAVDLGVTAGHRLKEALGFLQDRLSRRR